MANIKSAQKKARKDVKIKKRNDKYRNAIDKIYRFTKKDGVAADAISAAYSQIDKAAKRKIISFKRSLRLKSRVAKTVKKA